MQRLRGGRRKWIDTNRKQGLAARLFFTGFFMKLNVVSAWRRYSARVTVHAAEFPGATGAALRFAPGQALATLLGGPPPRAVGFPPTCVPTSSWVGRSWALGTDFSPYGFSLTQGKAVFPYH